MMKSMRSTVPKDGQSGDSFGNDVMESLFDSEVAKRMAGRSNLGLADMLYRSITNEPLPTTAIGTAQTTMAGTETSQAPPSTTVPKALQGTQVLRKLPRPVAQQGGETTLARTETSQGAPRTPTSQGATPASAQPGAASTMAPSAALQGAPRRNSSQAVPSVATDPGAWVVPSASTLDRIASYERMIQDAAQKHGVDTTMIKAVIAAESAGKADAVSAKDAKGLMQLTDSTAADMGVTNVWNPSENIHGGAKYLQSLTQKFPGDTASVIASYNAGPGRVGKHGGVPPIPETQAYVRRVMNYMKYFEKEEASNEGR